MIDSPQRPIALLAAVVLLALLALGGLMAAPLLLAEAAVAEQLDDHLGAIGGAVLAVAGVAAGVVGAVGLAGAVGVWRRSTTGWMAGAVTTAVVTLGLAVAIAISGSETALVLGAGLSGAGVAALWWPDTRRACGIRG